MRIGILAYGSLIYDPGKEIEELSIEKRSGMRTPFRVEFARKSKTRDGAPTLVPVDTGGSYVEAMLLVLKEGTTLEDAQNILFRRETNQVGKKSKKYCPSMVKKNQVFIELLHDIFGLDYVLYTRIKDNIKLLNPDNLAELAIKSAKGKVGKEGKDGISYLIKAKRQGIRTVLSEEYEQKILKKTGASTLEEAREKIKEL